MPERWFRPEEVDRLIPEMELIFGRVYTRLADLAGLRQLLEQAGLPSAPERLALVVPPPEMAETTRSYVAMIHQVAAELHKIAALGGIVKDLEIGVVDFPTVFNGKQVFLCWRYGEKIVSTYHDRHTCYGGRKPLGPGRVAIAAAKPN